MAEQEQNRRARNNRKRVPNTSGTPARDLRRRRRDAGDDLARYGTQLEQVELSIQPAPPIYASATMKNAESALRYLLDYMVQREIRLGIDSDLHQPAASKTTGSISNINIEEIRRRSSEDKRIQLQEGPQPEEFSSLGFWVTLFHTNAVGSLGRISNGTVRVAYLDIAHDLTLNADERGVIQGLPTPQSVDTPSSLSSITAFVHHTEIALRMLGISIDRELRDRVLKVLRYNGRQLRWYPTTHIEKLWLTRRHAEMVLAAMMNRKNKRVQVAEQGRTALQLVSAHAVVLALITLGFRQLCWVDSIFRPAKTPGKYLRWGHVTIRYLGHEQGEPQFVVLGRVLGQKHAGRHGSEYVSSFQVGTGTEKASTSLALALVVLAILSGAMPNMLRNVAESELEGTTFLAGRPFHEFRSLEACQASPVFVSGRHKTVVGAPYRHISDAPTPTIGDAFTPMTTAQISHVLSAASEEINLDGNIGASVLRRTWSLNAQLHGRLRPHQIADGMQHFSGNKKLFQNVYMPLHRPFDSGGGASAADASTSTLVQAVISKVGSYEQLPSNLSRDSFAKLAEVLSEYLDVSNDIDAREDEVAEEPQAMPVSSSSSAADIAVSESSLTQRLINTFTTVTGLPKRNIDDTVAAAAKVVELGLQEQSQPHKHIQSHPWDDPCGGSLINILAYSEVGGAVCHSCLGLSHTNDRGLGGRAYAYNKCLVELHAKSHCFHCWQMFSVDKIAEHVELCIQERLKAQISTHASTILTYDGFCRVDDNPMEAPYFVCPWASCLDEDMRHGIFTDDLLHLKSTAVQHYESAAGNALFGFNKVTVFPSPKSFDYHLTSHAFIQTESGCEPLKAIKSTPRGVREVICGISGCNAIFVEGKSNEGFIAYLCHLVNQHKLPILSHIDGSRWTSIQPTDFQGLIPRWQGKNGPPSNPRDGIGPDVYSPALPRTLRIIEKGGKPGKSRLNSRNKNDDLIDDIEEDDVEEEEETPQMGKRQEKGRRKIVILEVNNGNESQNETGKTVEEVDGDNQGACAHNVRGSSIRTPRSSRKPLQMLLNDQYPLDPALAAIDKNASEAKKGKSKAL